MNVLRSTLRLPLLCLAIASAPAIARAASDLVAITRAHFPDRAWFPLTAADAALVGAGRAVDPASSWTANPAVLGLVATRSVRFTGAALDPRRSDLRADTQEYSDKSPHVTFGELGLAVPRRSFSYSLFLAQDSYDKEREVFLDTGLPPIVRENEIHSALQRAGLALALAAGQARVGMALEVRRALETLVTTPSEEAQTQFGVVPGAVRLRGYGFGGAAGVVARPSAWTVVGASARVASRPHLENEEGERVGDDEIPLAANLGLRIGRDSGGRLYLGASYDGERQVSLGDSVGRGEERAPERVQLSAGYAFRPSVAPWEFRTGFGWSPHPADGGARFTRFGIGVGYDFEGWLARVSFVRERRNGPSDEESSRALFLFGLDARY